MRRTAHIRLSWNIALFLGALSLMTPATCCAGGIFHVFPPEIDGRAIAVARPGVLLSKALITVSESSMEYRIDQAFYNNNEFPLKGIYLLPLGKEKPVEKPELRVDLISLPAEVVGPAEFSPTMKELVLATRDPSLVGLAGQYVLVARDVTIGSRQQRSFRVKYKRPLTLENDQLEILLSLSGERYSRGPVGELSIRVRFKLSRTVRHLMSPTHHLSLFRESPYRCLATAQSRERRVQEDFRLLTLFSGDDLDVRVFMHRTRGQRGSFMAFLLPSLSGPTTQEPHKDVVFILDCSGSMGVENFETARSAVISGLTRLRPGDRFNVLTLATRVGKMSDRLIPANEENLSNAVRFLDSADLGGGTDLYNGIMTALDQFTSRRPCRVVIVGDGRSTVGVTDHATIIDDVQRNNRLQARIFTLAVGNHADVVFLDKLARGNNGAAVHAPGKEHFDAAVNRFLAQVSPPRASEISLNFDDVQTEQISPDRIPDLFGQDGIMVLGRYNSNNDTLGKVRLTARVKGTIQTAAKTFRFPLEDDRYPYIPTLWAMRRVAMLLETEKSKGADARVKGEIDTLVRHFGFQIPAVRGASGSGGNRPIGSKDGGAVLWALKTSDVAGDVWSSEIRIANGEIFRLEKKRWIHNRYQSSMPTETIDFLGDKYFALLEKGPEVGAYLALGPAVTFVRGSTAYVVVAPP